MTERTEMMPMSPLKASSMMSPMQLNGKTGTIMVFRRAPTAPLQSAVRRTAPPFWMDCRSSERWRNNPKLLIFRSIPTIKRKADQCILDAGSAFLFVLLLENLPYYFGIAGIAAMLSMISLQHQKCTLRD